MNQRWPSHLPITKDERQGLGAGAAMAAQREVGAGQRRRLQQVLGPERRQVRVTATRRRGGASASNRDSAGLGWWSRGGAATTLAGAPGRCKAR